jgi:Zn-dependent protease with chaperone function
VVAVFRARRARTRSVEFDHAAQDTLKEVLSKELPLPNLYTYEPSERASTEADRTKDLDEAMAREPTLYDSHPSPRQRIEAATQLAVSRDAAADDDAPV